MDNTTDAFKADPLAMATHIKPRKRPHSRGSTASIHSINTQPTLDQSFTDQQPVYSTQWLNNDQSHHKDLGPMGTPQMSPEDMILQAASQLQSGNMHAPVNHVMPYQQHHSGMVPHGLPDAYAANHSFTDHDSQMVDRDDNDDDGLMQAKGPQKPSRSSANNELEMRQLFQSNRHRSLEDVATELHGNERGPNSERTRQVFAMLWINQVCAKGKGSVPRGRVYANYANRCANERITVLNPASFGKLVRVLFPGLKTRRLGVRGESKYHYVNFMLLEDQVEREGTQPPVALPESNSFSQSFNTPPMQQPGGPEKTAFPSPDIQDTNGAPRRPRNLSSRTHSVYNQPDAATMDQIQTTTTKTAQALNFAPDTEDAFAQADPLTLPPLEPFLPPGTDPDAVKSLTALYRSHCTSLVECIRYCKEKTFFHLFTSFQGTLTMPVQKLFSNPHVAPWIEECDFILYQRMMRIVSGLTLQVVPKPVLDTLRNISERLVLHIRESFHGQPQHVVRAKEAPAAIFSGLLDRALRVNLTAHAAANMLTNPANRDQMYLDWITMVRVRKVAECVPTRGMDDVVKVLLGELRDLLDPSSVPWEIECLTVYGDIALRNGQQQKADSTSDDSAQTVLDRWVGFLRSLPGRFPYASHADIVWCVQRVGTAVMRDITIAGGKSFGSWWVTKCWIDEMVAFLAEQGGFMNQTRTAPEPAVQKTAAADDDDGRRENSKAPSTSEDQASVHQAQAQADMAPFHGPGVSNHADVIALAGSHDDSGIGIRTPEEDFPMDKFEFPQGSGDGLVNGDITHGSGLV